MPTFQSIFQNLFFFNYYFPKQISSRYVFQTRPKHSTCNQGNTLVTWSTGTQIHWLSGCVQEAGALHSRTKQRKDVFFCFFFKLVVQSNLKTLKIILFQICKHFHRSQSSTLFSNSRRASLKPTLTTLHIQHS